MKNVHRDSLLGGSAHKIKLDPLSRLGANHSHFLHVSHSKYTLILMFGAVIF